MTEVTLSEAADRIRRIYEHYDSNVAKILSYHGARIEAKAAVLTPVDKGFLRRANTHRIKAEPDAVILIIENRMIYARYQHDYPHNHHQPMATDHFIEIPFKAEIPMIVDHIISETIQEATS